MKRNIAIINNLSLSYLDNKREHKPVLIFLHGWRCEGATFAPVYNFLEKDYRIITIDFPGFGKSELPLSGLDINEYTKILRSFLEKLDIKSPIIIGHSFGGRVGISYASKYPKDLMSLVLINSGGIKNTSFKVRFLRSLAKIGGVFGLKKLKNIFYKLFVGESDVLHAKEYPALEKTFRNVVDEDLQHYAKNIQCPSLLLWGEKDTETPLWHGEKWHELISNSKLYIYPGDHFFFLKDPEWVKTHLIGFIEKIDASKD